MDDQRIVQHLPITEQGEHADFSGPGKQISIGIEISRQRHWRRSSMREFHLKLDRIVAHHHWAQRPAGLHKILSLNFMDRGEPGEKRSAFKARVTEFSEKRAK